MTRNGSRWLPAVVVPAVIAVGAFAAPWQAGAAVDLPEKTPQQVLALAAGSTVDALSGTIEQSSHLGLPELPDVADPSAQSAEGMVELLTGSHSARVYADGPDRARLQVKDRLGERDVILTGTDAWFYNFDDNTALHSVLPMHRDAASKDSGPMVGTPQQLAEHFLDAVEPSTQVTLGKNVSVAGRPAYQLVLTPRAAETLTRSVAIAVDAENGLPLSVDVRARGQKQPAFEVAFTDLSLATPDPALFSFTPPPGSTVTEHQIPAIPDQPDSDAKNLAGAAGMVPVVIGSGWDSVLELPAGMIPADALGSPLLGEMTRRVDGGHVLTSALVSVLFADDGRVFIGSVPAARLQSAAGR